MFRVQRDYHSCLAPHARRAKTSTVGVWRSFANWFMLRQDHFTKQIVYIHAAAPFHSGWTWSARHTFTYLHTHTHTHTETTHETWVMPEQSVLWQLSMSILQQFNISVCTSKWHGTERRKKKVKKYVNWKKWRVRETEEKSHWNLLRLSP